MPANALNFIHPPNSSKVLLTALNAAMYYKPYNKEIDIYVVCSSHTESCFSPSHPDSKVLALWLKLQ